MTAVFFALLMVVAATYAGYPALVIGIAALSRRRPEPARPEANSEAWPRVALVIPAHDEAALIEAKLQNFLGLDYPPLRLRAVVLSDGSTDGTCDRIRSLLERLPPEQSRRIQLVERPQRSGKSRMLSEEVPKLGDAEVIVFTDANAFFRADAIRELVAPLADSSVGLVCGRLRYVPDAGSFMSDEELYWRYEDVIKTAVCRSGRLLVANGSIYALRAELFRPIPGEVADDFATPLLVAAQGYRLVYAADAVAEERLPAQGRENFRAKARIVTRGARALQIYWREVLRCGPLRVLQYGLHKVARWTMGLVLAALLGVSLLGAAHPLLATALSAQVAFYLLGFAAYLLARRGPVPGVLRLPFYFLLVNAAALAGLWDFARGRNRVTWEKSETTRRSSDEEIALAQPHAEGAPLGRPFSRRSAVLVALALLAAAVLAAETGARVTYAMRDALRSLRGAVPPKGLLLPYEVADPAHPGNWLLRPGFSATVEQLSPARSEETSDPRSLPERAAALGIGVHEVIFTVNDAGFKGPPLRESGGLPRVLALGDSCTFGSLIDRYSYPRVLERELDELGTPAEVVNGGVAGYYPAHSLARLEEFAALKADFTLVCIGSNALFGERYTPNTLLDRMYVLRVLNALQSRWRPAAASRADLSERARQRPIRPDPEDSEIHRATAYTPPFLEDVRRIARSLRERGSHVYLLTLPSLYLSGERPEPEALAIGRLPRFTDNPYTLAAVISRYNQLLRETADQEGVELIDLASWARETLKPRHHYFASTLALNEAGQLQMGRRIASRLSRALAEREPD